MLPLLRHSAHPRIVNQSSHVGSLTLQTTPGFRVLRAERFAGALEGLGSRKPRPETILTWAFLAEPPVGFEPTTCSLQVSCSFQLS